MLPSVSEEWFSPLEWALVCSFGFSSLEWAPVCSFGSFVVACGLTSASLMQVPGLLLLVERELRLWEPEPVGFLVLEQVGFLELVQIELR